jgi:hypothetical protein
MRRLLPPLFSGSIAWAQRTATPYMIGIISEVILLRKDEETVDCPCVSAMVAAKSIEGTSTTFSRNRVFTDCDLPEGDRRSICV